MSCVGLNWTERTFGHLLKQSEDGTGLDEGPGLEEVHGRRELLFHQLPLLHLEQDGVQPLLGIRQHHLAADLHGGLQLDEGLSLSGVREGQDAAATAQERNGDGHKGAPQGRFHVAPAGGDSKQKL